MNFRKAPSETGTNFDKDVYFSEAELETMMSEYVTKKVEKHMKEF